MKLWPAQDSPHTVTVGATGPCNAAGDGNVQNDFYDNLAVYSNYGFDQNESSYLVMPGGQRPAGCSYPKPMCQIGSVSLPCGQFDMIPTLTRSDVGPPAFRGYTIFSSTSASTPHASGLAALLLSRIPGLTAGQLIDAMLFDLTVDIGAPGYDPLFGYGRGSAGLIP